MAVVVVILIMKNDDVDEKPIISTMPIAQSNYVGVDFHTNHDHE